METSSRPRMRFLTVFTMICGRLILAVKSKHRNVTRERSLITSGRDRVKMRIVYKSKRARLKIGLLFHSLNCIRTFKAFYYPLSNFLQLFRHTQALPSSPPRPIRAQCQRYHNIQRSSLRRLNSQTKTSLR